MNSNVFRLAIKPSGKESNMSSLLTTFNTVDGTNALVHGFVKSLANPLLARYCADMVVSADSHLHREHFAKMIEQTEAQEKYSDSMTIWYKGRMFTLYSSYGVWRVGAGGGCTAGNFVVEVLDDFLDELSQA